MKKRNLKLRKIARSVRWLEIEMDRLWKVVMEIERWQNRSFNGSYSAYTKTKGEPWHLDITHQ